MSTPNTEGKGLNLGTQNPGVDQKDTRMAELEQQLNTARVEQGRVKALSQELAKAQSELAQLKAQLEAQSRKYSEMLPEHLRQNVSEEVMQASGLLTQGIVSEQMQAFRREQAEAEERRKAEEAQNHERAMGAFIERIEAKYPGFLESVNPGGDKVAPWNKFLEVHRPSVVAAYGSMNLSAMSSLIDSFLSMVGVSRRGADANPPISPRQTSGGQADGVPVQDGRTYTFEEYSAAMDKAGSDFRSGKIKADEYNAVVKQLQSAIREKRVTRPVAEPGR